MRKSLLILALLLASCGGDGAGPSQCVHHVPDISNLKLTPDWSDPLKLDKEAECG